MAKGVRILVAAMLGAATSFADTWSPPHLTSWDDLDAAVTDGYAGMTNVVYRYPPLPLHFCVHAGYFTFDETGFMAEATNLLSPSMISDIPVWKVLVTETQMYDRVWLIAGADDIFFRTNAVPASFDPQAWTRANYGQPPTYLTGVKLEQWYASRERSRLHLGLKLILSNDWPTLQANLAVAATNVPVPSAPPPTMPLDTNRLSFAGIEASYSNRIARLWVYTPASEQVDIFSRLSLSSVSNLWNVTGTLDASEPFDTWDASMKDHPLQFYHAAFAGIDTDGDGLPDGREMLVFGTDPDSADTDNDGISDFEEINRYGSDPLSPDTTPPAILIMTPAAGSWEVLLP